VEARASSNHAGPTMTSFQHFEQQARNEGFDEVVEREWPPGAVLDTHTHPFSVKAVVVRGEMWLTVAGSTRHLGPGEFFELECEVAHAERYGQQGATYWVARRK
jgi:quercetin dioxygenase-like cupin family protein